MQASNSPPAPPASSADPPDNELLRIKATHSSLLHSLWTLLPHLLRRPAAPPPPPPAGAQPVSHQSLVTEKQKTVFYLAYGSNLSAETFRGMRGINPLGETNVYVPNLKLTFDLPGLPYAEPCFANSARRDPITPPSSTQQPSPPSQDAKAPLLPLASATTSPDTPDYRKDQWHKPLVGVLYELTPADFAHVIATEGGGASYQDIAVPCYELPRGATTVPNDPGSATPIVAHTLFAPADVPSGRPVRRPDTSYAQASARYLKLIHDGAAEHALPQEYRDYLARIRPYQATTLRQKTGAALFMAVWFPLLMMLFALQRVVAGKDGRSPAWLVRLMGWFFMAVWASYDGIFKAAFGDGERTIGE